MTRTIDVARGTSETLTRKHLQREHDEEKGERMLPTLILGRKVEETLAKSIVLL